MAKPPALEFGGDRISAVYRVPGPRAEAEARARHIRIEQTVEFPEDLVERADIREQVFGKVASIEECEGGAFEIVMEYSAEIAGAELTQLLNVLFGNISLEPGIRLERFALPSSLSATFRGPRFGRDGLRDLVGARGRPLLGTAIKPMGLSPSELARMAHELALGGIDVIKDDHGLADQEFCRYEERVERCCEAVGSANASTGGRCLYLPNVTAPHGLVTERARTARRAGAGGLVISPGLTGLDAMRSLADDDDLALPLLCHPALLGSFTTSPASGISHGALFGGIVRLAGADACIFPSFGGRFSFSPEACREAAKAMAAPMGGIAPVLPVPAGGMRLDRVDEILDFYGEDVILLIGGDLHRRGPDLAAACRELVSIAVGAR